MGKTSKPLTILVDQAFMEFPWVTELQAKGHTIQPIPNTWVEYDLLLSPRAARFFPGMEKFLESFIAGARKLKSLSGGGETR